MTKKIERINIHLTKCDKFLKWKSGVCVSGSEGSGKVDSREMIIGHESKTGASLASTSTQKTASSYFIKTIAAQKNELDFLVDQYFYSSNTAFRQIKNEYLKKLIEKLRPG